MIRIRKLFQVDLLLRCTTIASDDSSPSGQYPDSFEGPLYARKVISLLDRGDEVTRLKKLMSDVYDISQANCDDRSSYPVTFSSGMSGIGKTAFGEGAIFMILSSLTVEEKLSNFGRALNMMNYLKIDLNVGGDGFVEIYDKSLSLYQRLRVRLLARACRFDNGFADLSDLTVDRFEKQMKNQTGHISILLEKYYRGNEIPSVKEILEAIAMDHRNKTGDPRMKVGIFLHVDEHQVMFDEIMLMNGWEKANPDDLKRGLEEHKKFLNPLMSVLWSGWCFRNNVFLFPYFSGINHYCLDGLTARPLYPKREYIHLPPLRTQPSQDIIVQTFYIEGVTIENSWLTLNTSVATLSPIGILIQELGGNPRYLKSSYEIFGNSLTLVSTSILIEEQLRKIQAFFKHKGYNIGAGRSAVLAAVCGLHFASDELRLLNFMDVQDIAVLDGKVLQHSSCIGYLQFFLRLLFTLLLLGTLAPTLFLLQFCFTD